MNTKNLLLTIGITILTAVAFSVSANGAFLSPRAAGNQIRVVQSANDLAPVAAITVAGTFLSPRAAGNQLSRVNGTEAATVKCTGFGSPKYLVEAGSNARTTCCDLTLAECPTMNACAK